MKLSKTIKSLSKIVAIISLLFSVNGSSFSQCTILANAVPGITLVHQNTNCSNNSGVAFNPLLGLYYAVRAGNSSFPLETWSSAGVPLFNTSAGFDWRGMWWNPITNQLEGNGYNTFGVWKANLNGSGYAQNTGANIFTGYNQPDMQSCGDLDCQAYEILYYFNGSIYRRSRTTNAALGSYVLTGTPVAIGNLNSTTVMYTGCFGKEIALLDYVNKRIYLYNKATGAFAGSCQLPATAVTSGSFKTSWANGYVWLFNLANFTWYSYQIFDSVTTSCVVPPTVTVNSSTICANGSATVTATPGSAGTYNFAWTVPAGAAAPGNVASFTTSVGGTYSVIITNTVTGGVSLSSSGTVTINPLPTATVNNPSVCAGSPTTVTSTPGSAGTYSYAWTVPAGATAPGNVASFSTSVAGAYSVVITNTVTGCVGVSSSGTVSLNSLPTATVNSPTVCPGSPATVTATPGSAGTYSYAWTVPAGATAPGNVASFTSTVAGTYSVVITNTVTGCVGVSASGTVTLNSLPTATVNSQTVCPGASATITATPGSAGTYSYAWIVPAGATAPGNVASFTTTTAGTYDVIITNTVTGCAGVSASGTVSLNPLPTATVNSPTVCSGSSATVTATPGSAGTYDYAWTVPAGATAPGNVASFSTLVAGTYDVVITNTVTGCVGLSASGTVTLNALPTATISGTITICQGQTQPTITLLGANGTAPYTFTYNINGGANQTGISTGNSLTLNAPTSVSGTFDYNLVSVSESSSTACSQSQVGTATITVNPLPTATISASTAACVGGASQTVTFTGAGGTAPYTFTYNLNGGASQTVVSVGNTATITVLTTTAGVFNYNLVSVMDANIASCSQNQSGTSTITINALPTVNGGIDQNICSGTSITLSGSGANTYTWDNGITNGVAFTPAMGTTTYTVTGTSVNGCVNTDQVDVVVNAAAAISFTSDVIHGCAPLTVNFTNTTMASSNCTWTLSNGTVLTGCGVVSNTFTNSGCYDVTLTATSGGCTNSFTVVDMICVDEIPVASFVPSTSVVSEFNPIINFNNTSTGASNYVWDFGDNSPISLVEDPTYNYSNAAIQSYEVTLIANSAFGCSDTVTELIQVQEELIFYIPNTFTPDADQFNPVFKPIFTSGFDQFDYTMLIFNRWGEIVFESNDSGIGWDGTFGTSGNIGLVQNGTYTWRIEFKVSKNDERKVISGSVNVVR